ncbi:hypothetical protein Tco_1346874 [Tanacetum coccineum]
MALSSAFRFQPSDETVKVTKSYIVTPGRKTEFHITIIHDNTFPFAGLPDIGSPGVNGPLVIPEDPYAYVVVSFQAPPPPDYVSEHQQTEHPLPVVVSPTTDSPGYVPELDPEEDLEEEDDDEDPEEDPTDRGDDGDDEDESSDDDEDNVGC